MKIFKYRDQRQKWLYQRGGRYETDLDQDEKGEFVWMSNGRGKREKVYLPLELQKLSTRFNLTKMVV